MNRAELSRLFSNRAVTLSLPFAVFGFQVFVLALLLPWDQVLIVLGLMLAYFLPPAGKEVAIPLGIVLGIPWWIMAPSIAMVDVENGLFMAYNFDLSFRIPYIGKWLERFNQKGDQYIREHKWLGDLYFSGVVIMVAVPFMGSGGIRGSIVGRLLGMQKGVVLLAIIIGSFIGCFSIAFTADFFVSAVCASGLLPPEYIPYICSGT